MKPAQFEYLCPINLKQLLGLLSEYGEDSKLLSGGQSLIPLLNMRLSTPKYLIDLGHIEELKYIKKNSNIISIGSMTTQSEVEHSELVKMNCPILSEAIKKVGYPQIRNRGTIGGNIAHADPSSELPCVLTALRGDIVIANANEERVVNPEEFFLTYLLTTLEPTEVVKEVRFPVLNQNSGYAYVRLARSHGDFALVGVAAVIELDENGLISMVRLSIGGASPTPFLLEDIENYLQKKSPTEELFENAGEKAKEFVDPESDIHGTADYRLHLTSTLVQRALSIAADRSNSLRRLENE